ncbi:MAG: CPBP family intramembrane metalloprotease, partial [Erysipelotrichaceae bacterium]|nr:CPBP family intramembrane metalloprotease [Erysipelotrichaceae bacterium]
TLFAVQAAFVVCLHLITQRPLNLNPVIVLGAFCAAAAPGFAEELLFRGITLNNMMRVWGKTTPGLYKALILSSLLFGLSHISNILLTGKLTAAILWQIGYAGGFGILFGAIYMRTRNLWGCIILHTLMDFVPYLFSMGMTQNIRSAAATTSIVGQASVSPIIMIYCSALIFCCLAIGFYLIRPQKHAEIRAGWNLERNERAPFISFEKFRHASDWYLLLK